MWENIDIDRHYTGMFQILDEPISGELIYNKQNGTILLSLIKEVSSKSFFGKSYNSTFSVFICWMFKFFVSKLCIF